ncbi:hypothetical protein [Sporomusa aerivorans]|uniref:hypothetical protein n=1 Tax=Sporomusa aerivorans TaxID=204936 RepID=UPI00352ADEDE
MACTVGSANNVLALLKGVVSFLIDSSNFDTGKNWTLLTPASVDAITSSTGVILKGVGDGDDEIYVGMKMSVATTGTSTTNVNILLNGYAGYDSGLGWAEQPGAISLDKLPVIPLVDATHMTYWVSANSSRFIIMVELSTQYEGAYLGLFTPIAIENQYPYPLLIGGSYYADGAWTDTGTNHGMFTHPGTGTYSSVAIRRPDGAWRYCKGSTLGDLNMWPTNIAPVDTLTILDDVLTLENVIMYPFLMYENNPVGMIGQLDGVNWIGNREDLATKDSIVYEGSSYKIFNNVSARDKDSYFAIKWS